MSKRAVMGRQPSAWLLLSLTLAAWRTAYGEPIVIAVHPNLKKDALPVPSGFLGLSLEPVSAAGYYADDEVFQQLVKNLVAYHTGPFNIRWGGHTQDDEPTPLPNSAWDAMTGLYDFTGQMVSYTLPISLQSRNASVAATQVQDAVDNELPGSAIYAINVGNEPDRYIKDGFPDEYYKLVTDCLKAFEPILEEWVPSMKLLSGPAVSDITKYPIGEVAKWAALAGGNYTKIVTWHYYVANARNLKDATISYLLNEAKARRMREHVKAYSDVAREAGIAFRMDETNSISHSGTLGVSNTLAAALWLVDHALGVMQAGAVGLNFHNAGCSPYSPILFPGTCKDKDVSDQLEKFEAMCPKNCGQLDAAAELNAPYYGLLFVNKVLRNHANVTMLAPGAVENAPAHVGVFVLKTSKQLRVVLVNKQDAEVALTLNVTGPTEWGFAAVSRMTGGKLDSTFPDMNVAGLTVDPETGKLKGALKACKLSPSRGTLSTTYSLTLLGASATVVVIAAHAGQRADFDQLLTEGLDPAEACPGSSTT